MVLITHFPVVLRCVAALMTGALTAGFCGTLCESLTTKRPPPLGTQLTILGFLFLMAALAHGWLLLLVRKIVIARGAWKKHGLSGSTWLFLLGLSYFFGLGGLLVAVLSSGV